MDALTAMFGRFDGRQAAANGLNPQNSDMKDVSAVKQVDKPLRMEGQPLPRGIQDEAVISEVMKQMFEDPFHIALVTIRLEAPSLGQSNSPRVDVLA
jgi:hypothetical protein